MQNIRYELISKAELMERSVLLKLNVSPRFTKSLLGYFPIYDSQAPTPQTQPDSSDLIAMMWRNDNPFFCGKKELEP